MEKEGLAVFKALKYFKPLIFHAHITIETNHSNLTFMDTTVNQKMIRWCLVLAEFNLTIKYIKGEDNEIADTLSRAFLTLPFDLSTTQVIDMVKREHLGLLHPGEGKLYYTLKHKYLKIEHIAAATKYVTNNCELYQKNKPAKYIYGKLYRNILTSTPFEKIHLIIYGSIDSSKFHTEYLPDKVYVLTMIDNFSKYLSLGILEGISSKDMCSCLRKEWLSKYPMPKKIVTDCGRQFISAEFIEMLSHYSIKHQTTLNYHPRGNSTSDHVHSDLENILRIHKNEKLETIISKAVYAHNNIYHTGIGTTPINLAFKTLDEDTVLSKVNNLQQIRRAQTNKRVNNSRINYKYENSRLFAKQNVSSKLNNIFDGPFRVLKVNYQLAEYILETNRSG